MKPTTVLEVGTTCHVNCTFCYKEYEKNNENYFKSIDQIKDEIKTLSIKSDHILLAGGEPALYPKLIELLEECKKYNITVCLVTLGDRLNDKKFLESILKVGVITSIQISIHTLDTLEGEELYGIPGVVDKQVKGVKNLIELGNVNFGVNVVMNKININSIGDTIIGLNKLGVNIFYISAIHIFSGITKNNIVTTVYYIKIKKQLEKIKDLLKENKIRLALKSFPLCIHKYLEKFSYEIRELNAKDAIKTNNTGITDWEEKKRFKIELEECKKCYAYLKKCFGPYEYYVKMYGSSEFKNLSEEAYINMIENNGKNVW